MVIKNRAVIHAPSVECQGPGDSPCAYARKDGRARARATNADAATRSSRGAGETLVSWLTDAYYRGSGLNFERWVQNVLEREEKHSNCCCLPSVVGQQPQQRQRRQHVVAPVPPAVHAGFGLANSSMRRKIRAGNRPRLVFGHELVRFFVERTFPQQFGRRKRRRRSQFGLHQSFRARFEVVFISWRWERKVLFAFEKKTIFLLSSSPFCESPEVNWAFFSSPPKMQSANFELKQIFYDFGTKNGLIF